MAVQDTRFHHQRPVRPTLLAGEALRADYFRTDTGAGYLEALYDREAGVKARAAHVERIPSLLAYLQFWRQPKAQVRLKEMRRTGEVVTS